MLDLFGNHQQLTMRSMLHDDDSLSKARLMTCDTCDESAYIYNCDMLFNMPKVEKGHARHILTNGNMDLTSFVVWANMRHDVIDRLLVCAWSYGFEDLCTFRNLCEQGKIREMHIVASDLHPKRHANDHQIILRMREDGLVRSYSVTNSHAKIALFRMADGTSLVLNSSANCTLYPCVEVSVITNSVELYQQYLTALDLTRHEVEEKPTTNGEREEKHRVLVGD